MWMFWGFYADCLGRSTGHVTAYAALDHGGVRSIWLGLIEFSYSGYTSLLRFGLHAIDYLQEIHYLSTTLSPCSIYPSRELSFYAIHSQLLQRKTLSRYWLRRGLKSFHAWAAYHFTTAPCDAPAPRIPASNTMND